jgi:phage recombination protein Bet
MSNIMKYDQYMADYKTPTGEQINLSTQIVRQVLAVGDNITDIEIFSFIKICEYQKLNPFLKEAHLIKWGKVAQIVVGKDVFTKRLDAHPLCEGWKAGLILLNDKEEIIERVGTFYLKKKEKIVGAFFSSYRKGWKEPFYWSVTFDEFYREFYDKIQKKNVAMGNWGIMPGIMIVKCAITSGARNAYPKDFEGLYGEEELGISTDSNIKITVDDPHNENNQLNPAPDFTEFLFDKANEISSKENIKVDPTIMLNFVIEKMIEKKILKKGTLLNEIPENKLDEVIKGLQTIIAMKKKSEDKKKKNNKDLISQEEIGKASEEAKNIFEDSKDKNQNIKDKKDNLNNLKNINLETLPMEEFIDE